MNDERDEKDAENEPKAYSLHWVEGIRPDDTDKFVETVGDHRE